jgi:hypothetical protein
LLPTNIEEEVKSLQEALGGALERLSGDLYKDDHHFLFELIQNSDDNDYTNDNPQVLIILKEDSLQIVNNEVGFGEENIKAICTVNKSTKKEDKSRIGHKGLGFKAVFKVTDQPTIVSNGWQFRFNAGKDERKETINGLGMIVPEWVDDPNPVYDYDQTNIYLPFNEKYKMD